MGLNFDLCDMYTYISSSSFTQFLLSSLMNTILKANMKTLTVLHFCPHGVFWAEKNSCMLVLSDICYS